MIYALFVGGSAFLLALVLGAFIVPALRARKIGKVISAEGPTTHHVKEGTPTMGGLIIYGTVAIVTVLTNIFEIRDGSLVFERRSILLPLFVVIFTMAIGFWDDLGTLTNLTGRRALSWRIKFFLIGGLSAAVAYTLYFQLDVRSVNVPWAGQYDLGPVYLLIAVVTVFATTSAVSITA